MVVMQETEAQITTHSLGTIIEAEPPVIATFSQSKKISTPARPFIKWAGGKRWFLKVIDEYLPQELINGEIKRYVEPFVGGGAVFFHIKEHYDIKEFIINDKGAELIETYRAIQKDVDGVIERLLEIEENYKAEKDYKKFYYNKRRIFNEIKKEGGTELAALFIFLNKASFNGIFRLNQKGEYNVPVGYHDNFAETDRENLRAVSMALDGVSILNKDFREIRRRITKNSFVYIDPPYTVSHENNGFIEYNQKIFSWEDQTELKEFSEKCVEKGAWLMISNARHENILDLYKNGFTAHSLSRASLVGGKGAKREHINEALFLSYTIKSLEGIDD